MKFCGEKRKKNQLYINLYDDPSAKTLRIQEIKRYLQDTLDTVNIHCKKPFPTCFLHQKQRNDYAKELTLCKVQDLSDSQRIGDPLPGEIQFERTLLEHPEKKTTGIFYDGYRLSQTFRRLLPQKQTSFNTLHLIFTNRLFGTFEEGDSRYHARVIICGYPSILSTTGIVEAPAKPQEYYILKQHFQTLGVQIPQESIIQKFQGDHIEYDDPRLTEVLKGYVMQAVFYHLTYEPFCTERSCRLFNAHWQKEVIEAQLQSGGYCKKHQLILEKIKA